MKKLNLNINQYAIGQAEYKTGHILKTDRTLYLQDGEVYLIFDSKESAIAYVVRTVNENPEIECWIENNLGEIIVTIDKNGRRNNS